MEKRYSLKNALLCTFRALVIFFVYLFISSLISFLVGTLAKVFNQGLDEARLGVLLDTLSIPSMIIAYIATVFVFVIIYFSLKKNLFTSVKLGKVAPIFVCDSALLGLGFYGLFQATVWGFSYIAPKWVENQSAQSASIFGAGMVVAVIYTVFIAPVCEELVFRGLILGSLENKMPKIVAVLISAVLFSVIHLPSQIALIYTFIFGLLLGFVYLRTKSLATTIAMHAVFNASNYLLYIPKKIGFYAVIILALPLIIYSVIDIIVRTRRQK